MATVRAPLVTANAPFKHRVLPAAIARVRRKLRAAPDGDRQMVEILGAVLSDGLPAVEAACAEALREGVHSADPQPSPAGLEPSPIGLGVAHWAPLVRARWATADNGFDPEHPVPTPRSSPRSRS